MKRLTVELVLAAIVTSILETALLYAFGFLRVENLYELALADILLTIIELLLTFILEELLIRTKNKLQKH